MIRMTPAELAVLLKLYPIGRCLLILRAGVVTAFTLGTLKCNYLSHRIFLFLITIFYTRRPGVGGFN